MALTSNLEASDTIVVGYTEGPPFIYKKKSQVKGISVWLWEEIAHDLDLDFVYKEMDFNPLLDGIKAESIDVCINSLTVTSDRLDFMEFTFPFFSSNSAIVVKEEGVMARAKRFFKPIFTVEFLGALFLLVFIIFLFGFLVWLVERKSDNDHFRKGIKGIWDGIWWSSVTVTTVGYGDKTPTTRAGKIFALLWMFIALIFISSLTAGLTSNFTESKLSLNTTTFQDFKNKKVGTVKNSGTHLFLKDHFFKDLYFYEDLSSGLDALNEGEIEAFSYDEPNIAFSIRSSEKYEGLRILPLKFDQQFYAFGFSKGNEELLDKVNLDMIRLTETKDWQVLLAEYELDDSHR